jgi:hypothetical protein
MEIIKYEILRVFLDGINSRIDSLPVPDYLASMMK